jgi:hypothetical protein
MNLANPISGFVGDPRGVAVTVARALALQERRPSVDS